VRRFSAAFFFWFGFGVRRWPGVKLALTGYPSDADLLR
jgi:hypothetical protein